LSAQLLGRLSAGFLAILERKNKLLPQAMPHSFLPTLNAKQQGLPLKKPASGPLESSQFGYGPDGRVESAGYTVDPELRAYQDRLMAAAGQGLGLVEAAPGAYAPLVGGAQRLFDLGSQYVAQSPEEAAARYIQQQQNLLAPSRERQFAQLQNQLFNTGRGGLAVGATGMRPSGGAGLGAANPEMEAYYNALAQQDATLATQGMQEGQRQTAFGAGLFGTGAGLLGNYSQGLVGSYSPFLTGLGAAGQVEQLGMEPLTLGSALGGRVANPTGANALLQGGMGAAQSIQRATSTSPMGGLLSGLGQQVSGMDFGSMFKPSPTDFSSGGWL